jgi:hypothetical protein
MWIDMSKLIGAFLLLLLQMQGAFLLLPIANAPKTFFLGRRQFFYVLRT